MSIQGEESIFYIKYSNVWLPISCEVSSPISESTEMINTTTRDNQGWKTEKPTMQSYTIAVDAVEKRDDFLNVVSYRKIRQLKRDRTLIEWKRETLGFYLIDSGFGHISEISDSNTAGEEISFNFTINGFGRPRENELILIWVDDITYNFTYSHEPENEANEGQWFLTNLLFNNYVNPYGVVLNCDLKIQILSVPVKGFLANNITRQIYAPLDFISYCDKDDLVYFPNGFDNDLGVSGNFGEIFTYKVIDQNGRTGKVQNHTINMVDSAVEPIDISVSISWLDLTSTPKTGNLANITVKVASLVFDPLDPIITQEWEIWNGTAWIFYKAKTTDTEVLSLSYLDNKIRLKVVSQFSVVAYSNILTYMRIANANIYVTDKNYTLNGVVTYKLHVENEPFVGFANMIGEKVSNVKNAIINDTKGYSLAIPAPYVAGDIATKSTAVNIPIGIYDCTIRARGVPLSNTLNLELIGAISYNYTNEYYYDESGVEVQLFIPAST